MRYGADCIGPIEDELAYSKDVRVVERMAPYSHVYRNWGGEHKRIHKSSNLFRAEPDPEAGAGH